MPAYTVHTVSLSPLHTHTHSIHPPHTHIVISLTHNTHYHTAHAAYLSCNGSVEGRELFLTIGPSCHQTSPSLSEGGHIRLVIQPVSDSALERGGRKDGVDFLQRCDSFELGSEVKEPTPFSSRRTMFSTGKSSDKVRMWACGHMYTEC